MVYQGEIEGWLFQSVFSYAMATLHNQRCLPW